MMNRNFLHFKLLCAKSNSKWNVSTHEMEPTWTVRCKNGWTDVKMVEVCYPVPVFPCLSIGMMGRDEKQERMSLFVLHLFTICKVKGRIIPFTKQTKTYAHLSPFETRDTFSFLFKLCCCECAFYLRVIVSKADENYLILPLFTMYRELL